MEYYYYLCNSKIILINVFYKFFIESSLREKETSSNVENNLFFVRSVSLSFR